MEEEQTDGARVNALVFASRPEGKKAKGIARISTSKHRVEASLDVGEASTNMHCLHDIVMAWVSPPQPPLRWVFVDLVPFIYWTTTPADGSPTIAMDERIWSIRLCVSAVSSYLLAPYREEGPLCR